MHSELVTIARALHLQNSASIQLQKKALQLCTSREGSIQFLMELKRMSEENPFGSQDLHRAFISFFTAYASYEIGVFDSALTNAISALEEFRHKGDSFNESLIHWFLSLLYRKQEKENFALVEQEKAVRLLKSDALSHEMEGNYKSKSASEELIKKIIKGRTQPPPNIQSAIKQVLNRPMPITTNRPSQLAFPVYGIARAGREESFIFDSLPITEAYIDTLTFDGIPHQIFNIREGSRIILNLASEKYRWIKVEGDSMSEATPIPIIAGDFVLVEIIQGITEAKYGNLVVAAIHNPSTTEERAGIIKKLTIRGLASLSNKEYPILPVKDVDIRGVVIAVAKRVPSH